MKLNIKTIVLLLIAFLAGFFGFKYTFEFFKNKKGNGEQTENNTVQLKPGFTSLFDGKSFQGWQGYGIDSVPDSWKIIERTMEFQQDFETPRQVRNLGTDGTQENFILALDWKNEKEAEEDFEEWIADNYLWNKIKKNFKK